MLSGANGQGYGDYVRPKVTKSEERTPRVRQSPLGPRPSCAVAYQCLGGRQTAVTLGRSLIYAWQMGFWDSRWGSQGTRLNRERKRDMWRVHESLEAQASLREACAIFCEIAITQHIERKGLQLIVQGIVIQEKVARVKSHKNSIVTRRQPNLIRSGRTWILAEFVGDG